MGARCVLTGMRGFAVAMESNQIPAEPAEGTSLSAGAFSGRTAFRQHVRDILALAVVQEWPAIVLSDPDFADWPLGEKAVVQSLHDWSKSGRSLIVLASSFELVLSHHARFVDWRRRWDHIVNCRRLGDKQGSGVSVVPSVVWTPGWVVQRTSIEKCVGLCTQSAARRAEIRESLDNSLKQSTSGFAASQLGL